MFFTLLIQIKKLFNLLLDIFFPIKCVNCKKDGGWLCPDCLEKSNFLKVIKCPYCKCPIFEGYVHQKCHKKLGPERIIACVPYYFPWREVVHTLKFKKYGLGTLPLIEELLTIWRGEKEIEIPKDFLIIPVPLHWQRRFFRQYNQAEEIAKVMAKVFELSLSPASMNRFSDTIPQSTLLREDRKRNIKGAFIVKEKDKEFIKGKSFLLVDDVFTSGATLLEACSVLKKAGAKSVWLFALAKV